MFVNKELKCPFCGSKSLVYKGCGLSYPPVDIYTCDDCKHETSYPVYATNNTTLNFEKGKMGWICPICNIGVNPNESVCPHCKIPKNKIDFTCSDFIYSDFVDDNAKLNDEIAITSEIKLASPISNTTKSSRTITKKKTEKSEKPKLKR
jgi:hypothetical protein